MTKAANWLRDKSWGREEILESVLWIPRTIHDWPHAYWAYSFKPLSRCQPPEIKLRVPCMCAEWANALTQASDIWQRIFFISSYNLHLVWTRLEDQVVDTQPQGCIVKTKATFLSNNNNNNKIVGCEIPPRGGMQNTPWVDVKTAWRTMKDNGSDQTKKKESIRYKNFYSFPIKPIPHPIYFHLGDRTGMPLSVPRSPSLCLLPA